MLEETYKCFTCGKELPPGSDRLVYHDCGHALCHKCYRVQIHMDRLYHFKHLNHNFNCWVHNAKIVRDWFERWENA